jgi:hypothetical protein
MKANELRVTNFVQYKNLMFIPVLFIGYDSVELVTPRGDTITAKLDEINPIFLNKEWLLKFHSVDEIEISVRFPNGITIYDRFLLIWKEEYEFWYVVTADHKEYLTKIEFVHEYQNFIFALTGQELELK